ncbi:MAG: hypothetical protein R6V05_12655, partial [Candidatus Brocadiia bacterium]
MKTRRAWTVWTLALAVGALCAIALAAQEEPGTPDVMEIVRKSNQVAYYQGGTGRARVKMTVTNAKGNVTAERELVILRRNVGDNLNQ